MNTVGYHTPKPKVGAFLNFDGGKLLVLRNKVKIAILFLHPFHGKFAIDKTHQHGAGLRLERFVDNQNIAIVYSHIDHRIAPNTGKKSGAGMLYQQVIQVEFSLQIIVGRRGKPSANKRINQRKF